MIERLRRSLPALLLLLACGALAAPVGAAPVGAAPTDAADGPETATPEGLLLGAEWVIEDIGHAGIIDNSHATLEFRPDGRVGGRGSCNNWSGTYELAGTSLVITGIASTRMACAEALMDQERRFFDVLGAVERFKVTRDGALVLSTAEGGTITARR